MGPTAAALISHRIASGNWRAVRLWTSWRQLAGGIFVSSILILLACFGAAAAVTQNGLGLWNWGSLARILPLLGPNLLGGPMFEEPGWRGYALPRLQERFRPWVSALVLGFLWANWHLPLFVVHFTSISYWLFVPLLIADAFLINFVFNLSGGNTLVAIYAHGLINVAIGVIMNDFLGKATLREGTIHDVLFVLSFVAVAVVVAVATRGRLGQTSRHTTALRE
jgi:membrane protease YdiL (CAAX protease family)